MKKSVLDVRKAHTRMCQEYPVSLVKLSFFFIQVKIIQVLVFDNWHPLKSYNREPVLR